MKVICAYSACRQFQLDHVVRLYDQVRSHAPDDISFICVTNKYNEVREVGIAAKPLIRRWPGYWCKVEMLLHRGPCLSLDLDVTILGDLSPILKAAYDHEFIASCGYHLPGINSSVMAWNGDVSELYRQFAKHPQRYIEKYRKGGGNRRVGDQAFIGDNWRGEMALWQDILPGMVMSYKREWVMEETDRHNCRVVFFHGRPRPWQVPECTMD